MRGTEPELRHGAIQRSSFRCSASLLPKPCLQEALGLCQNVSEAGMACHFMCLVGVFNLTVRHCIIKEQQATLGPQMSFAHNLHCLHCSSLLSGIKPANQCTSHQISASCEHCALGIALLREVPTKLPTAPWPVL